MTTDDGRRSTDEGRQTTDRDNAEIKNPKSEIKYNARSNSHITKEFPGTKDPGL
jgi:hypothetical protein